MASMRRVSEGLFRRDMCGPSFGHVATAVVGLLLIEKLTFDYLAPLAIPLMEASEGHLGRTNAFALAAFLGNVFAFWVVGSLMAIPAIFQMKQWKIQVNRSLDIAALCRSMPLVTFNFVLGLLFGTPFILFGLPERSYDLKQIPSTYTLFRDVIVWLVVEEVVFFYTHRLWHVNKKLYSLIHKIHHTWTSPVSFTAIYCHPLEHIIGNTLPVLLGPLLCGSHIIALTTWTMVFNIHALANHSGYWFCDDNGMHDEHHRSFNCNYGVLGVMDALCGTLKACPGCHEDNSREAGSQCKGEKTE